MHSRSQSNWTCETVAGPVARADPPNFTKGWSRPSRGLRWVGSGRASRQETDVHAVGRRADVPNVGEGWVAAVRNQLADLFVSR